MVDDTGTEVLVIGAGPVGLFSALALRKRGIEVRIIDSGLWSCKHSYALALHPQSLKLLQETGLLDRALEGAYPVRRIGIYDRASCRAQIQLEEPGSSMALTVLRQDTLEDLLESALRDLDVNVSWRHEVARLTPRDGVVEATINKFEKESRGYSVAHTEWVVAKSTAIEVPFVIGADGYNSLVRRTLHCDFPEVGPAAYFAVFEFKSNADLDHEVRIVLGDQTTDVLWPLPGGNCRWSFQLTAHSDADAEHLKDSLLTAGVGYFPTDRPKDRTPVSDSGVLPTLEDTRLHSLISERAPWFISSIDKVTWRTVVRFERRLSTEFGRGRLWLAGDAAHLTGPVGIQSMNVGLFEAHDLAERFTRILRYGEPLSELNAYGQRWMATWRQLQGMDGGLRPQNQTDPWIQSHSAQLMSCLPAHGAQLRALAAQLQLQA